MKTPRISDFDPNVQAPKLKSPMENMPVIQKQQTEITTEHTNQQTYKPANQYASKPANIQTSKLLKKFTSYLTPESLRAIKRIAFESDRKDYEVLQEAIDSYIKRVEK